GGAVAAHRGTRAAVRERARPVTNTGEKGSGKQGWPQPYDVLHGCLPPLDTPSLPDMLASCLAALTRVAHYDNTPVPMAGRQRDGRRLVARLHAVNLPNSGSRGCGAAL